ncbi:hypothetical protein [Limnoglobus roseus]|uniref:Uncharacterized protein n=1 Tax=Limnoglobus roseus TaxID=2598579 RepID=A0A5C1ATQ3_9BACT|nr:hypothetical protein [Limnoglobus roseus]QEL20982.1 hypothetical protein PX52LOC_08110 [Limnoglobus roseus]
MSDPFPVENRANLSPETFEELAGIVSRQTSIKHALDWLLAMSPPAVPVDAIAQDEFSHDIPFPYPAGCWLVYECT